MGTVISNLKAHFGVDTSDFKTGLKDGEKAMSDFKGAAGDQVAKFAQMFGVNMTGVTNSLGTVSKSLNFLSQAFKASKADGDKLAIGMDVLKKSIMATGIGALILALASLGAYFGSTERGAKQLASGMTELKAVGKVLLEHLGMLGEGLVSLFRGDVINGFSQIKEAFTGIREEAKSAAAEAKALAQSTYDLNYMTMQYNNTVSEENIILSTYRLNAKDSALSATERLKALEDAATIEHKIIKDGLALDTEKLLNAQMALQTDKENMDLKKALSAAYDAYNYKIAEEIDYDRTLEREKTKLIKLAQDEADAQKLSALKLANTSPSYASLEAITLPDFSQFSQLVDKNILAPLGKVSTAVTDLKDKLGGDIMKALEELAGSVGEILGNLASGASSIGDFGKAILGAFGDLLKNLGLAMIAAGMAKLKFDAAMIALGGAPFAIAAGIALVAMGTALKGLSSAHNSISASSSSGGSYTYDAGKQTNVAPIEIVLSGKLTAEGSDLVLVLNKENYRKYTNT
ncbi:MAG: hypothetical protein ABSF81_18400 [Bacteroidales bacterium]